jgi:hypothetical protein
MQISAHYTGDLKRTYRMTARLRRRSLHIFRALGALLVLLAGPSADAPISRIGIRCLRLPGF